MLLERRESEDGVLLMRIWRQVRLTPRRVWSVVRRAGKASLSMPTAGYIGSIAVAGAGVYEGGIRGWLMVLVAAMMAANSDI